MTRVPTQVLTATTDRDPLPPPVQELRDAVHAADALLICTPEYAGALPGAFKNLLEWLIGDNDPRSISGKPVGWINVSTGPTGARDAHESLRIVLTYAGARIVLSDSITVPRSAIADGLVADASIVERLAGTFDAAVTVGNGENEVSALSIMGLMMLAASKGNDITLRASGRQAEEALEALCQLVASRFGEKE